MVLIYSTWWEYLQGASVKFSGLFVTVLLHKDHSSLKSQLSWLSGRAQNSQAVDQISQDTNSNKAD